MSNEYSTIDIAPEEEIYTDPKRQPHIPQSDALADEETKRLLKEVLENQIKQTKHLKSISTNTSILATVVIIEIIATILIFFR